MIASSSITERLDDLEGSLPPIPSRALAFSRATTRRAVATATEVADHVGRRVAGVATTASNAARTTAGQARSAVERTAKTARDAANEVAGQNRAQTERTGDAAREATTALLDEATRAMDPDTDTAAALEDWTKSELYDRAQALDIEGRSNMTKDELISAIRAA